MEKGVTPIGATKTYDAYGNLTSNSGTWQGAFGYAGDFGYQEDGSNLKLLGHRYYDSSTGRFLTRDPVKDGRNWYVYCGNSPLSRVDPNGYEFRGIELGTGYFFIFGGSIGIGIGKDTETGHFGGYIEIGAGVGLGGGAAVTGVRQHDGIQPGFSGGGTISVGGGPFEFEIPLPQSKPMPDIEGEAGLGVPGTGGGKYGVSAEYKVTATMDITDYIEHEKSDWERSKGSNPLARLWDYITKPNQDWRKNLDEGLPIYARRTD